PPQIRHDSVMRWLLMACLVGCAQAGATFSNGSHNPDAGNDPIDAPGRPIDAPGRPIDAPGSGSSGSGSGMGPTTITLKQNTADTPISIGVGCNDNIETTKNEFYRVFDLAAAGITTTFTVTQVTFGVESMTGEGDIDVSAVVGTYTGTAGGTTLGGTFAA